MWIARVHSIAIVRAHSLSGIDMTVAVCVPLCVYVRVPSWESVGVFDRVRQGWDQNNKREGVGV